MYCTLYNGTVIIGWAEVLLAQKCCLITFFYNLIFKKLQHINSLYKIKFKGAGPHLNMYLKSMGISEFKIKLTN